MHQNTRITVIVTTDDQEVPDQHVAVAPASEKTQPRTLTLVDFVGHTLCGLGLMGFCATMVVMCMDTHLLVAQFCLQVGATAFFSSIMTGAYASMMYPKAGRGPIRMTGPHVVATALSTVLAMMTVTAALVGFLHLPLMLQVLTYGTAMMLGLRLSLHRWLQRRIQA